MYKFNANQEDFVDSLVRYHNKYLKQSANMPASAPNHSKEEVKQPYIMVPLPSGTSACSSTNDSNARDPFILEIESLAKYGQFSQDIVQFCKQKHSQNDKKIVSTYQAYLRTTDRDDFIDSIKRYYKKS